MNGQPSLHLPVSTLDDQLNSSYTLTKMENNLAGFDALTFSMPRLPIGASLGDSGNPNPPDPFDGFALNDEKTDGGVNEEHQFDDSVEDQCSSIFSHVHINTNRFSGIEREERNDHSVVSELTSHTEQQHGMIPPPATRQDRFSRNRSTLRGRVGQRPGASVKEDNLARSVASNVQPIINPQSPSDRNVTPLTQRVPPPIVADDGPFFSTETFATAENRTLRETSQGTRSGGNSPHAASSPGASTTSNPHSLDHENAPQKILYSFLNMAPERYVVKPSDYVVWDNGGEAHNRWYTAAFIHPSQIFYSGQWTNPKHFKVGREERPAGTTPLIYYSTKKLAKHAAAARAYDCLVFQEMIPVNNNPSRLCQDDPNSMTLPGPIPPEIEEQIQRVKQEVQTRNPF